MQRLASSELEVLREIEQQRHFVRPEGIALRNARHITAREDLRSSVPPEYRGNSVAFNPLLQPTAYFPFVWNKRVVHVFCLIREE